MHDFEIIRPARGCVRTPLLCVWTCAHYLPEFPAKLSLGSSSFCHVSANTYRGCVRKGFSVLLSVLRYSLIFFHSFSYKSGQPGFQRRWGGSVDPRSSGCRRIYNYDDWLSADCRVDRTRWATSWENLFMPLIRAVKGQGSRSPIIGPVNSQTIQIVCKTYLWSF